MEFTAHQIAEMLGGKVVGDANVKLHTIAKIEEGRSGAISFLANLKYEPHLYNTESDAVLVNKDFKPKKEVSATLIYVEDAYAAFTMLLQRVAQMMQTDKKGLEKPCFISESAQTGKDIYVGAFSYIGDNSRIGDEVKIYPQVYIGKNVTVGSGTVILPGVKIFDNSVIGQNCTLHPGAIIGSDGFGFAPMEDGSYQTIPQIGNVVLEDFVSIGANTTIDCATMGSTYIEEGVKLDNLVQIAHNVRIGKHTVMAAQSGISGSSKLGAYSTVAGQVGIVGHIEIADRTLILAQSGISNSVKEEGTQLLGSPASPRSNALKTYVLTRKLPDLYRQVQELEKELKKLKSEGLNKA